MILPDINVLVYAFREGEENSAKYREWLIDLISGPEELALLDPVLAGFVRVVTNPRVANPPAAISRALAFVDDLRTAPKARWLHPGAGVWETFGSLASQEHAVSGTLLPDAFIAANAIVHGAVLATADRAFDRFPGLRWFDPATG
jgi:toxin-antitoxin system PIN domain toxin